MIESRGRPYWMRWLVAIAVSGVGVVVFFWVTSVMMTWPFREVAPRWEGLAGFGASGFLFQFLFVMGLYVGVLPGSVVAAIVCACRPEWRHHWWGPLGLAGVLWLAGSAGWEIERAIYSPARLAGFARVAENSKPLITAIERFHSETGKYPESLNELVPSYLASIPATGIHRYRGYQYDPKGEGYFGGDGKKHAYALFIPCTVGMINWDSFQYFPEKAYPERMAGGSVERIGDWAYVHE